MTNKVYISLALAALLVSGCGEKKEEQSSQPQAAAEKESIQGIYGVTDEVMKAEAAPQQGAPAQQAGRVGVVVETMDAAGYTYAKVNENGEVYWIAGPQTSVKTGDTIAYDEQTWMENFPSKSLNKTFDKIMFVGTIAPSGGAGAVAAHDCDNCGPTKDAADAKAAAQDASSHKDDAVAHMAAVKDTDEPISVEKLAGGLTVAEIFEKKAELNTKTVKLKAKVTKLARNIMGKNWVHLQDGTGAEGANDLTVTTSDENLSMGDTVTVEGVIKTNIDFGYGYSYAVIMEEAKFTK